MAIHKPSDGSIDSRPRCSGHCCKCFSLQHHFSEVQADYQRYLSNPKASKIPQVDTIMNMVIPLGMYRGQETFTCKNLQKNGDCGIYETRPQMCRDFPGPSPCPYRN